MDHNTVYMAGLSATADLSLEPALQAEHVHVASRRAEHMHAAPQQAEASETSACLDAVRSSIIAYRNDA